jgi:hypothetical protein
MIKITIFLLAFLSITVMSYGMPIQSFAADVAPLTVNVEFSSYREGAEIVISGLIRDYDQSNDATIRIQDPNGSFVYLGQITPNPDGTYSVSVTAGGTINKAGEYTILAFWNSNRNQTTFEYFGSSESAPATSTPTPTPTPTSEPAMDMEPEPVVETESVSEPKCGAGTVLKDGQCVVKEKESSSGGGCLIATAAYGSEMAPQIQFLREIRDNTVLQTESGSAFMTGFNQFYYSFSPAVADYERENPVFKETVKLALTPMLTSLAILNYVDIDSETEMLGYGIGIILLNIGMYFVAPAVIIIKIKNRK